MLRLNERRLLGALDELASIGAIEGGGCARLALTDEDKAGRDLVVGWMKAAGLEVRIDAIGNVIGLRAGREKLDPVMTGSHIDTVRTGGRYDGNYGVLAGLEGLAFAGRLEADGGVAGIEGPVGGRVADVVSDPADPLVGAFDDPGQAGVGVVGDPGGGQGRGVDRDMG